MSTRHVVLIGLDGLQLERLEALLSENVAGTQGYQQFLLCRSYAGGVTGTDVEQETMSGPGWATILTGVWRWKHGISTNDANARGNNTYPSVFHRLASEKQRLGEGHRNINGTNRDSAGTLRAGDCEVSSAVSPALETYCFTAWPIINSNLCIDETVATRVQVLEDRLAVDAACEVIRSSLRHPSFIFIHIDDIDETGHSHGFGPQYNGAVLGANQYLLDIIDAIKARTASAASGHEEWMVMIVTDHGRDAATGRNHGGQSLSEKTAFVGFWFSDFVNRELLYQNIMDRSLSGGTLRIDNVPTIPNYSLYRHLSQASVTPSVLSFLRIAIPPQWRLDGRSFFCQEPVNDVGIHVDCAFVCSANSRLYWGIQDTNADAPKSGISATRDCFVKDQENQQPFARPSVPCDNCAISAVQGELPSDDQGYIMIEVYDALTVSDSKPEAAETPLFQPIKAPYAEGSCILPQLPKAGEVWDIRVTRPGGIHQGLFWTRVCGMSRVT